MGRLLSEEVAGMGRGGLARPTVLAAPAGPAAPGLGALLIKRNANCCEDGRRGGRDGGPEAGSVLV